VTFRVVLADDNRDIRTVWRGFLDFSPRFVVVGEAGDGREALALCREHRPDAVVTDWSMPNLDGVALARRLREEQPGIVVVLCSSRPRSETPRDLCDPGVVYLNKLRSGALPELLTQLLTTAPSQPTEH